MNESSKIPEVWFGLQAARYTPWKFYEEARFNPHGGSVLLRLAAGQVVEEIIARVNSQIITRSEFLRSKDQLKDDVKQQDAANADKLYNDREKDVLRDLIDQQLLIEKGKDLGITGDTELIKRLDQMRKDMKLDTMEELEKAATAQGISYEDFKQNMRNQIITQKVIGEEVGSHLSITKDEEQKFYEQHKNEMEQPEAIKLSEILVAPHKTVEKPVEKSPRRLEILQRLPPRRKDGRTFCRCRQAGSRGCGFGGG